MAFDVAEFKKRCQYAQQHGFAVARAEEYVARLGGGVPPVGVKAYSPDHLLHLIEQAEKGPVAAPVPVVELMPKPVEISTEGALESTPEASPSIVDESPPATEVSPAPRGRRKKNPTP